jgi:hypothetical protein
VTGGGGLHPLSYAIATPRRRWRRIRRALAIFAVVATGYVASYYGWVRDWERTGKDGRGEYSLHYDRIPNRRLADMLQRIHEPLQLIDARRYVCVTIYQLDEPLHDLPEDAFDHEPDFVIQESPAKEVPK